MFSKKIKMKIITAITILTFSATIVPVVPVSAALIDNNRIAAEQTVAGDRALVMDFMGRADVRSQFEALGVDADEANLRVAALSDAEVAKLANEIKTTPAGQGAIGGIIGAVGTGIFTAPSLGGTGAAAGADYALASQTMIQIWGVGVTVIWSGIVAAVAFKVVDLVIGLRPSVEAEREGLDLTSHGEVAYHS